MLLGKIYFYFAQVLCFVAIFLAYPILYGIYLSFTDYSPPEPSGYNFIEFKNLYNIYEE